MCNKRVAFFIVPLPEHDSPSSEGRLFKISGSLPTELLDRSALEAVSGFLKMHGLEKISILEMKSFDRYKTHARVAETLYSDRIALCGDAAHLFPPRSGQGVTTGVEDAFALAEELIPQQGGIAHDRLQRYSDERKEVAREKIEKIDRGKKAYSYRRLQDSGLDVEAENLRILRHEL